MTRPRRYDAAPRNDRSFSVSLTPVVCVPECWTAMSHAAKRASECGLSVTPNRFSFTAAALTSKVRRKLTTASSSYDYLFEYSKVLAVRFESRPHLLFPGRSRSLRRARPRSRRAFSGCAPSLPRQRFFGGGAPPFTFECLQGCTRALG